MRRGGTLRLERDIHTTKIILRDYSLLRDGLSLEPAHLEYDRNRLVVSGGGGSSSSCIGSAEEEDMSIRLSP